MTSQLPSEPSLVQLRKQAKDVLKAHRNGDASCCAILRNLDQFRDKSDGEVLAGEVSLVEVQFALAMEYGFKSWANLKNHVGEDAALSAHDYSDVQINGKGPGGHEGDHFSLAVQAACKLLGKDVDYEKVACISTNTFAPTVHMTESKCWWTSMYGRDTSLDLLCSALGLSFRKLEVQGADMPPYPDGKEAQKRWLLDQRLRHVPHIQEAQAAGEVVLIWREWITRGQHGFVPWAWWGIVTEARDDGTVLGATCNGYADNPLGHLAGLYALGDSSPTLSEEDADTEMLRRAMHRIRAEEQPYGSDDQFRHGLSGMDALIEQMPVVPYCHECHESAPDRVWTCVHSAHLPIYGGAKTAAKYLEARWEDLPAPVSRSAKMVGECYDRIDLLMTPAMAGEGSDHCRAFTGDPQKQKEFADTVLRPVRAEMAEAADEIEKALAVME